MTATLGFILALGAAIVGLVAAGALARSVLEKSAGSERIQQVGRLIQEGANSQGVGSIGADGDDSPHPRLQGPLQTTTHDPGDRVQVDLVAGAIETGAGSGRVEIATAARPFASRSRPAS